MKRRNLIITAVAIVIALAAVPFSFAQMRGHHRGGPGSEFAGAMAFGHLDRAKAELGLSDQQVADIKAIFKGLHDQNAQYRDSLKGGRQAIIKTLLANPNDVAGAQALLDQQSAAERAMKANLLTAASKALNVLTPDQRTKLAAHLADRQSRMQQRRERRGEQ